MIHYMLNDNNEPVEVPDVLTWAHWYETAQEQRRVVVGQENIGSFFVSTVFLGVNHRFNTDAPPILFETMVFRGKEEYEPDELDGEWLDSTTRHETWGEAEEFHENLCESLKEVIRQRGEEKNEHEN